MKMLIQFWFQRGGRGSCLGSGGRQAGGCVCAVTLAVCGLGWTSVGLTGSSRAEGGVGEFPWPGLCASHTGIAGPSPTPGRGGGRGLAGVAETGGLSTYVLCLNHPRQHAVLSLQGFAACTHHHSVPLRPTGCRTCGQTGPGPGGGRASPGLASHSTLNPLGGLLLLGSFLQKGEGL